MRRRFRNATQRQVLRGRYPLARTRHHRADALARLLQPLDFGQGHGRLPVVQPPHGVGPVDRQKRMGHLRLPGGQRYDPERAADPRRAAGRQLRMVVRGPRFAGRHQRRGVGHRLQSRSVRAQRQTLLLDFAHARRNELRLGRAGLLPHRRLRHGDRQALQQAVLHDGHPRPAGRRGARRAPNCSSSAKRCTTPEAFPRSWSAT